MKLRFACCATLLTLILSGCESLPTNEQMKSANYGSAPNSEKSREWAKQKILSTLLDPYSAAIECGVPHKGVANFGLKNHYGYLLKCRVNAKNAFGGYTGEQERFFWINNGQGQSLNDAFEFVPARD